MSSSVEEPSLDVCGGSEAKEDDAAVVTTNTSTTAGDGADVITAGAEEDINSLVQQLDEIRVVATSNDESVQPDSSDVNSTVGREALDITSNTVTTSTVEHESVAQGDATASKAVVADAEGTTGDVNIYAVDSQEGSVGQTLPTVHVEEALTSAASPKSSEVEVEAAKSGVSSDSSPAPVLPKPLPEMPAVTMPEEAVPSSSQSVSASGNTTTTSGNSNSTTAVPPTTSTTAKTDASIAVADTYHRKPAEVGYFQDSMDDLRGVIGSSSDASSFPLIEQRRLAELRGPSATDEAFVGFLIHSAVPGSPSVSPTASYSGDSEDGVSSSLRQPGGHGDSVSAEGVGGAVREIQSSIDPPPLSPELFGPVLSMSTSQAGVVIKALKRALAAAPPPLTRAGSSGSVGSRSFDSGDGDASSGGIDASSASSLAAGLDDTMTTASTVPTSGSMDDTLGGGINSSTSGINSTSSSGDPGVVAASAMWCAARISAPDKTEVVPEAGGAMSQLQQQQMEVPVSMSGLVCQLVGRYIDNASLCAAAVATLSNIWTSVFSTSSVGLLEVLRKRQRQVLVASKVLETVALVYDHYSIKLSECAGASTSDGDEVVVGSRQQQSLLANSYALLVEHCCIFFISTCQRSNALAAASTSTTSTFTTTASNATELSGEVKARRFPLPAFGYVSAIDGQLYAAIRKKYSAMRLELALVRSMSVICGAIANGVLSNSDASFCKPEEMSSLKFTERLIISSCRVGIALADSSEGRCRLLYQDVNADGSDITTGGGSGGGGGGLSDGIAAALCTVLALHATHPAVVVWVAKCAYALSIWQPSSQQDPVLAQNIAAAERNRWSVVGHLGQSVVASALAYHSKLLLGNGSPSFDSSPLGLGLGVGGEAALAVVVPKMDQDHKEILLSASQERINRWGAVTWGLRAVGMITCGPASTDATDSDQVSIADVNRGMLAGAGVCDSILHVLKLAEAVLAREFTSRDKTDLRANAIGALEAGCWALSNACTGTDVLKSSEFGARATELLALIVQDAVAIKASSHAADINENEEDGSNSSSTSASASGLDALIREACIAVHRLAGCMAMSQSDSAALLLQALLNLLRYYCSKPDTITTNTSSTSGTTANGSVIATTTNSSRVVKYVWYAISGLARCPNSGAWLDHLHMLKPYRTIADTFEIHGNNDDTMLYVCSTVASLATHSIDCCEAMAKAGVAAGLLSTLSKFIAMNDVVKETTIGLAGLLATDAGKMWFARSTDGPDVVINALTRFSKDVAKPVGMFDPTVTDRIQDESAYPLVNILDALDPAARGKSTSTSSSVLLLRDISTAICEVPDRNVTLALLVALVHGTMSVCTSSSNTSNSNVTSSTDASISAVFDNSGVLLRMGNVGAVKLVPKLLCGLMHEAVIAAAAANVAPTKGSSTSTSTSSTSGSSRKVVNVDITMCKWLCRAVGGLGAFEFGATSTSTSTSVARDRIFVNLLVRPALNATVAVSSRDAFQHGRMNAIKMGHTGEMFEALLLLSLYAASSSPLSDISYALVGSVNRALSGLAGAAENHNRLRTVTVRVAGSTNNSGNIDGTTTTSTTTAPSSLVAVGISEVAMSCIETYAASTKTSPSAETRARLRYSYVGLVEDFCVYICSLSEPGATQGGIETSNQGAVFKDWLGDSGVIATLPSFLSDMLTILDHSTDAYLKLSAEKAMLEVLMATVSAAFRHATNILSLEATSLASLLARILHKHTSPTSTTSNTTSTTESGAYSVDILSAALLLIAVLCDASPRMRKTFADLGLIANLHDIFTMVNQRSPQHYTSVSAHRITSALCRVASSVIYSECSVNDDYLKGGNFYNNLYGGFESSSTTHSLRGVLKKFIEDRRGAVDDGTDNTHEVSEARADGSYYKGAGRAALSALSSAGSILSGMTSSLVASLSHSSVGGLGAADSAKKALQLDDSGPYGASLVSIDGARAITIDTSSGDGGKNEEEEVTVSSANTIALLQASPLKQDILMALSMHASSTSATEVFVLPQILLAIAGLALNDVDTRSLFGRMDVAKYILNRDFSTCSLVTIHHTLLAIHSLAADNHVENITRLMDAGAPAFLEFVAKHHIANAEYVAWSFCRAVDCLAMEQNMLVCSDVIDGLLIAFMKHIRSPRVCVWALRALSKLIHDPSVRARLCASTYGSLSQSQSAVQIVQRAIMRQGMAVPIAQWGCLCLKSFTLDTSGAAAIVKSGGLETMSACMVRHPMDAIVALRCCTLLTSLVFISADSTAYLSHNEGNVAAGTKALGLVRAKIASHGIPDALVGLLLARRAPVAVVPNNTATTATTEDRLRVLVSVFDCFNALIDGAAIRDRLCAVGICEILPEILNSYVTSQDVVIAGAAALATLVDRHEAGSLRLVRAGVLVVLISAMKIHQSNVDVMDSVCNAISKLAQVRDNREVMGSSGCIESLVSVLSANRTHTHPALQCIWALGSVASDVPNNAHIIAQLGVCDIIVQLRTRFPTNDGLAIAICRLIAQLGAEELSLELSSMYVVIVDILKTSIDIPETQERNPQLVEWACRAVGAISVSTKARLLLGSCKAPEALTDTLSNYIPSSAIVTREAVFALSCVCEGTDVGTNIDQVRDLAGKLTIAAIQAYYDDAEVVWCACKLFISLSSRPEFLLDISVGDYVISVMQKHYKNSMVTEWGCRALASLSSDEKYRDVLVGRGACDAIVQALRASVSSGSVMSFMVKSLSSNIATMLGGAAVDRASLTQSALGASACSTIFSLADTHDEYRQRLGDAGACEAVVKVLLKFSSESPDVAGAACQAIVSLCRSSPSHRLKLGNAGACKGITTVLHKYVTDEAVSYLACCAAVALIPDATYIECSGELSNRGGRACRASKHRSSVYSTTSTSPETETNAAASVYESSDPDGAFILEYQKLNATKLGVVEGCDAIAMALQTHQSSERLARVGCWAVALLAGLDADILVRLGTVGACEAVVTMLQRHSRQPSVCEAGCIALARLAVNNGNSGWLGAAGGCTVVLDAISKHPDQTAVGRAGWAAIASLANDEGNRSRFGLMSGCEAAVGTITRVMDRCDSSSWDDADQHADDTNTTSTRTNSTNASAAHFTVAEECCSAVSHLCRDADNLTRLYALEAPQVIIRVLRASAVPSGLSASACGSMASLVANNATRRQLLGELGACDAVVGAMITQSREPSVQIQGCIALHTLSLKHPNNQTLIGNAGGCEVLLNVLRLHGWSQVVAEQVCRATNTLILEHVENQGRMGSGDACKLILTTIKVHMRSSGVVNRASCALFNLTVDSALCREQALAADGAVTLVTALQDHLQDEPVCVRVALTLKTLTFDVEGQNKLGDAGAAKYLVKALSVHEASGAAVPLLLSVFAAFVINHPGNQGRMNAAGACKAIVSATYKHMTDVGTVTEACNAMLALGDGNEDCKTKLATVGAIELCTAILQAYSTGPSSTTTNGTTTTSTSTAATTRGAMEVVELARSCRAMLAGKAPSNFFSRQFAF